MNVGLEPLHVVEQATAMPGDSGQAQNLVALRLAELLGVSAELGKFLAAVSCMTVRTRDMPGSRMLVCAPTRNA